MFILRFLLGIIEYLRTGPRSELSGVVQMITFQGCDYIVEDIYTTGITRVMVGGRWFRVHKYHNHKQNMAFDNRGGLPDIGDHVERRKGSTFLYNRGKPAVAA